MSASPRKKSTRESLDRLNNARAEGQELKNLHLRGELVELEDVEAQWRDLAATFKNALSSLPARMARRLVSIDEPAKIFEIVQAEIEMILENLARQGEEEREKLTQHTPPEESIDEPQAVQEEKPKRVKKKEPVKDEPVQISDNIAKLFEDEIG